MEKIFTTDSKIKENGYRLDLKWIQAEDDAADLTLSDVLEKIKEKSSNIAKAVEELEKLIGKVDE